MLLVNTWKVVEKGQWITYLQCCTLVGHFPIARRLGLAMGCIFVRELIYVIHELLQCYMKYHAMLSRVVIAPESVWPFN